MWKRRRKEWRCKEKGIRMEPDLTSTIIKKIHAVEELRCRIQFEPWHWDHLKEVGDDSLTDYIKNEIGLRLVNSDDFWKYVFIDISDDYQDYPAKVVTATLPVVSPN